MIYDAAEPLPGVDITKGNEISVAKRYSHSPVQCSALHCSQCMETAEVSVNG